MIPRDYVTAWRATAPWVEDAQVEQDLVISRALVEMFSHPLLARSLAFRGGTALYKMYLGREWDAIVAARVVTEMLLPRLPGQAWQGRKLAAGASAPGRSAGGPSPRGG